MHTTMLLAQRFFLKPMCQNGQEGGLKRNACYAMTFMYKYMYICLHARSSTATYQRHTDAG